MGRSTSSPSQLPEGIQRLAMQSNPGDNTRSTGPESTASSGSDTLADGVTQRDTMSTDNNSHTSAEGAVGAAPASTTTAMAKPRNQPTGFRPTSYLFEDPDAMPPVPIPEMQKLTSDVPAKDQISITLGPFVILFCDLVIPCIIYYSWLGSHSLDPGFDPEILGYAVISFGLGEAYILVVRVYRLIRYNDQCAPLLSRHKWELDATSWIYGASLLAGLIPFVVGSTLAIPELYLYSPGIYMAFLGFWCFLSLIPFKLPVRVGSEKAGTIMQPLVYYAAEDFFAVDGWQKRDFRVRYRERYATSIMFRKMIFEITVWWCAGIMVYIGCLSAVIWNNPFHIAFGLSLGVLFSFIILWAICTYVYIQIALEREREWWIKKKSQGEKA